MSSVQICIIICKDNNNISSNTKPSHKRMYYSRRQLNLVKISLKQGKGPVLEKMKFITLIEVDFQIEMGIELGSEMEELIEKDD